jgi:hypothetical protein
MINAPNLLSKIWLDQIIIPIAKKHQQIAKKLRIDEFSGTILTGLGVLLRNEMLRTRMASIPQKIYSPLIILSFLSAPVFGSYSKVMCGFTAAKRPYR